LRPLFWFVFGLSSVPSLALADEPSPAEWARRRVEHGLVKPLAQTRSNSFSRGRPIPSERRARVTNEAVQVDEQSREFLSFSIDIRYGGGEWRNDDVVGCVYRQSGNIYVKVGDEHRPAAFLLGKNVQPVAGACETASPKS
jgi:hypothetical protein